MSHTDCKHDTMLRVELDQLTAQQRFDRMYVTSAELAERCGVSRAAVTHALRRGMLPVPASAAQQHFWEREELEPYIAAWRKVLGARRSTAAVKDAVGAANAAKHFAPLYHKPLTRSERKPMEPVPILDKEDE